MKLKILSEIVGSPKGLKSNLHLGRLSISFRESAFFFK